jgi:hypothetical protein
MSASEMKLRKSFRDYAYILGLKPEHLDEQIEINSQRYIIAGARPRAKNAVVLKRMDGQMFAFNEAVVKANIPH